MPPLRMPHHAMLCSSCLNCQSNFRLKVFLLFLTPTAVSFFVYSFFCFSHASVLPDFLNWLFTLPPLHMPPHATLCSSSRVPAVVFQQSCSSSRVPAVVFQQSCSSSRVPASVIQQSCFSIYVSASVIQHLCFSIYVSASVIQHLCFSIYVSVSVIQHLCLRFSNCVSASAIVFQLLCSNTCACSITNRLSSMTTSTICVSFCVPALFSHLCCSVFQHLCSHLFFINNRLPSMTTLIICIISAVAIFPTISPFGIDGNMYGYMSFISPPLTSRAKG
jgi:hypothetical protein